MEVYTIEVPIRCFTCGKVIGHLFKTYQERIKKEDPAKVLDDLGLKRYCCRRHLITHVSIIDQILPFNKPIAYE